MTPEYLHQLADLADPNALWSKPYDAPMTDAERNAMMTGVALAISRWCATLLIRESPF